VLHLAIDVFGFLFHDLIDSPSAFWTVRRR
jgi:hypothetical protein